MDFIMQPWPWWFSGILIGLTVPLLYLLAGRSFGISTSFQQIGAMCAPNSKLPYLRDFNKRKGIWTLVFVIGIAIGGFIANHFLSAEPVEFLPESYQSVGGAIRLLIGGVLIGALVSSLIRPSLPESTPVLKSTLPGSVAPLPGECPANVMAPTGTRSSYT